MEMDIETMDFNVGPISGPGILNYDLPPDVEKLAKEIIGTKTATFGAEHPDTLQSMMYLAFVYLKRRRFPEAIELYLHIIKLGGKVWGFASHPQLLRSRGQICVAYYESNMLEKALEISNETLEILSSAKADEANEDRLWNMSITARCEVRLGTNHGRAVSLLEEVLSIRRRTAGNGKDISECLYGLSMVFRNLGRILEAVKVTEELVKINRFVYGMEHRVTLEAISNLAALYHECGRANDSMELLRELLDVKRRLLGTEHVETLAVMDRLAYDLIVLE